MKVYKDDGNNWFSATTKASDGRVIFGRGMTPEQAQQDINEKLEKVEVFLSLKPENQLRVLCGGRMSPNDQEAAIKLLAQIVLDNG